MKKHFAILAVVLSAFLSSNVHADPVFGLPTPSGFTNNSYAWGELFTVGSEDIRVFELGAFDDGLDGFGADVAVGIYRQSDGFLLSSTTVSSTDNLVGNFRYADVADFILSANTQYQVVAVSGNENYNTNGAKTVSSLVTRQGSRLTVSTTLVFPTTVGGDTLRMANFNANVVPEPGTFGVGLIGLAAVVLRRRKR